MVGLGLEQRDNAFGNVRIFINSGSILLIRTVKKLAAILACPGFEYNKVATFLFPIPDRAGSQMAVRGIQPYLGIGYLDFHILPIALPQGGLDDPSFAFANVWYFLHRYSIF